MDKPRLNAISLGWGVQSFTLAVMSALGDLPPVDVAIHADTTHEAGGTYEFAARWTPWLEEHDVRVVTVRPINALICKDREGGEIMIPARMDTGGSRGKFHRQCTHEWKRVPMRRWLQANRARRPVEQWLGISMDEIQRMKDSDVKYITNRWPLIEKRMTRQNCVRYLEQHDIEVPPKSACYFCPLHDSALWRSMKAENGPDWQRAVEVDKTIRKARPPYDLFLHQALIPLSEVDLRSEQDKGQLSLSLWDEECTGYCGV